MKRFAAHYIFIAPETRLKQHYIELSDDNTLIGIFPLTHEIAQTAFYNGTLIIKYPVPENESNIEIYHWKSLDVPPSELSTDDCSSNSNIKRLC